MNHTKNALILLLAISGSALADDAAILRCRGIGEATARLACYDALVVPTAAGAKAASKPAASPESRPSPSQSPSQSPSPASSPAVAAAPVQTKTDQFGLENRPSAVAPVDVIESYIPGRFEGWEAKSTIKLANGQVWQITDDSRSLITLVDPKVKVRRGALGAFYLEFEKINHAPRVRRLQ